IGNHVKPLGGDIVKGIVTPDPVHIDNAFFANIEATHGDRHAIFKYRPHQLVTAENTPIPASYRVIPVAKTVYGNGLFPVSHGAFDTPGLFHVGGAGACFNVHIAIDNWVHAFPVDIDLQAVGFIHVFEAVLVQKLDGGDFETRQTYADIGIAIGYRLVVVEPAVHLSVIIYDQDTEVCVFGIVENT